MTTTSDTIILVPIIVIIVFVTFIILYMWRYRKFQPNEFVIWLRNGKIRKAEKGGAGFLYPKIDSVVSIPVALQVSKFETEIFEFLHADYPIKINFVISWRVFNPEFKIFNFRK